MFVPIARTAEEVLNEHVGPVRVLKWVRRNAHLLVEIDGVYGKFTIPKHMLVGEMPIGGEIIKNANNQYEAIK